MDNLVVLEFIRKIIYFISIAGILVGLDLLLGAKVTANLKKMLDEMTFNVDNMLIRISSLFRKTIDKSIDVDSSIIKTRARVILGFLFIAISVVMILLVIRG